MASPSFSSPILKLTAMEHSFFMCFCKHDITCDEIWIFTFPRLPIYYGKSKGIQKLDDIPFTYRNM